MPTRVAIVGEGDVNRGALAARAALEARGHSVVLNDTTGADVVLAASDAALLRLAADPPPPPTRLAFPPDAVARVLDKPTLAEHAARIGIPTPRTLPDDYTGRAVVKARSHSTAERQEAIVTDDPQAARKQIRNAFLQEAIDGPLTALTVVTAPDGTRLGHVFQRAVHVWPQPAGVSCRAVTEPADPALTDNVHRLLAELGWWGVAQAQFLDGRLIDLNPRLYGSLALAIAAGVDVPNLLVADAPTPVGEGRPGVRYQWLEGDLRYGGLRNAPKTLAYARGAVAAVPHARAALDVAKRAIRKVAR